MRRRDVKLALLGVACTAALCAGATWTWVDNGEGHAWDTCRNWITFLDACYPSTSSDDPVIPDEPDDPGYWIIDLIDIEALGDINVYGSVVFGTAGGEDPTIEPNSFWIQGYESNDEIVVTADGGSIYVAPQ